MWENFGMARRLNDVAEAGGAYGFASADEVRRRCIRFILKHVPLPPCRVLEFSVAPGGLGDFLAGRGYRVSTLASATVVPETLPLWLSEYARRPGGFDAVLVNDTAQHFDAPELLSMARDVIAAGGRLIILRQAAMDARGSPKVSVPVPEYSPAMVLRHGFVLMDAVDLASLTSDATADAATSAVAPARRERPQADYGYAFHRIGEVFR